MDNLEMQGQEGQENQSNTQQERTFSQQEVDKIIGERLARERNNHNAQISELQEVLQEIEDFGYVGTPKEKAEAIRAYKAEIRQQSQLEELQQQAEENGVTPALAKKILDLEQKLEASTKVIEAINGEREAKQKEAEKAKKEQELWDSQVKEFEESYPDIDLTELDKNTKFIKFIKGRNGSIKDLYEDFVDFIGDTEKETIVKMKSKEMRSTTSSKGSGSSADGGTYGLTDAQMETLKEWNARNPKMKMSAKEFASYSK